MYRARLLSQADQRILNSARSLLEHHGEILAHYMSFRVRLNNVDNYQAKPSGLDPPLPSIRPGQVPRTVPVIRVYGATETGQKVCAHIHGVFPYLYVEYTGSLIPDEGEFFFFDIQLY